MKVTGNQSHFSRKPIAYLRNFEVTPKYTFKAGNFPLNTANVGNLLSGTVITQFTVGFDYCNRISRIQLMYELL